MKVLLNNPRLKQPAIIGLLTVCASLVLLTRANQLPTIWFATLNLLQSFESTIHADIPLALRSFTESIQALSSQGDYVQTLSSQILKRGELATGGLRPRFLVSWFRVKWMLMVAVADVSVIIPTWNEEKYLERCLTSLHDQSLKQSFEIIVVDGGSSDRTLEIANRFAQKVLVMPDKPVGAARNVGASNAKGDILAFIDADTQASNGWLEETIKTFNKFPSVVGITGPTLPHGGSKLDDLMYGIARFAQRVSLKLGFPHVAGFNCAYRKNAFWGAGGFDENRELSEDVMLSLRMRKQGRVLFNKKMIAYTSLRRIRKSGYPYLIAYYTFNAFTVLLFGRTLTYPKVR